MYRPEGWGDPLTKARLLVAHNDFNIVDEAYEAGADAMLEGLRKEGWLLNMDYYVEENKDDTVSV